MEQLRRALSRRAVVNDRHVFLAEGLARESDAGSQSAGQRTAPAGLASHEVQTGRYRCWLQNGADSGLDCS